MERIYNVIDIKSLMAEHLAKHIITEMVEPDVPEILSKTRAEENALLPC